jgi:hypothetical protein
MRYLARRVTLAAAFLTAAVPSVADVRILSSPGGQVSGYLNFYGKVKQSGERVIIDGPCLSACTLVLSTIPRRRICVTSRAVLGFHAPYLVDKKGRAFRSKDVTRAMAASYPSNVQAWIKRNGGLSRNVIYLRGRELTRLYPRC